MRNYTHCCKFYPVEDKHIAVNFLSMSIGEAAIHLKEHNNIVCIGVSTPLKNTTPSFL